MQKKFLLVLDDVWTEDYNKWETFYNCLKNGVHGSIILITTRNMAVARMMKSIDIMPVEELADEESWSLFKQLAFFERSPQDCENLEDIGRKLVVKCKGLPLATKTIGSLLRFKTTREEWQYVLDSEIWELEEFEKGILPPLLLSYNDLSSITRRCFSYCAIFPKDYVIVRVELIKLWMAQGYLGLNQDKELEIIGLSYFNNLASRSFFQEFKKDDDGNIGSCKMHDIVHDFAQFLSKNECLFVEVNNVKEPTINSFTEKVRHAMLVITEKSPFYDSIYSLKRLRSLLIDNCDEIVDCPQVLPKLIEQCTCLRALHINGGALRSDDSNIKEIPREIGKLIHLRYLKLSWLAITELPDAIYELYNLQTLDMSNCPSFRRLAEGIEKLINLRSLELWMGSKVYMPKRIRKLTCLRTLRDLRVCGSGHDSKACTLDCLKQLNYLRGSLRINGLGNVIDVDEAKEAKLDNKKNLFDLRLSFDEDDGVIVKADNERVLEALQPPPQLGELMIQHYKGITISPRWMMSLTKLRKLTISHCVNCEHLPPLGKLSYLESLVIGGMMSVKGVGNEFLGLESAGTSSSSLVVLFPKLKELSFFNMDMWEDWDYQIMRKGEENYTIMPFLNSLLVHNCPKLKALPEHLLQSSTLKRITIHGSPVLNQPYKKGIGEDWSKICDFPTRYINEKNMLAKREDHLRFSSNGYN